MMSQSHNTYTIDCKLLCEITPSNVWKDNACDVSRQMINVVVSNNVLVATIAYDAKSRRVKKVTPEAITAFFYDDWNLIEERVAYTNGISSTIRYYWGKDISGTLQGAGGVGGLLRLMVDGAIYVPFYDNIGNVTRYLDENGNTVAQYTYDAFGKLIAKSGPLADFLRHRFSTKYFDADSPRWNQRYRRYRNSGIDKEDMNTFVIKEDNMQNIHLILQLLNGSSR